MTGDECRLNLAHQSLKTVPQTLINNFCDKVKILDLTNNLISDVSFLGSFNELSYLILDHNRISDEVTFPVLPKVTVLWLNHNDIRRVEELIPRLRTSFPCLKELTLMGNPCAVAPLEETFYDYLRYRFFVLFWFPKLDYLDDRLVTQDEVEEASRLFKKDLFDQFSILSVLDMLESAADKVRRFVNLQFSSGQRSNFI